MPSILQVYDVYYTSISYMPTIVRTMLLLSLCLAGVTLHAQQDSSRTMHGTLTEVVVSGKQVQRILEAPREYVIDYAFADDNILLVTYSGTMRKTYKLFLMDGAQKDTLSLLQLNKEPLSLYKSCVGKYYCVCDKEFYPITIKNHQLQLEQPYPIALLSAMRTCEYATDDKYYYRFANKEHFDVSYAWEAKGDTTLHVISHNYNINADRSSSREWAEILYLLQKFRLSEAARKSGTRYLLNNASYAYIDMPIYTKADTLVLFDSRNNTINFYNLEGTYLGKQATQFEWGDPQYTKILTDDATGQFYLWRNEKMGGHSLYEFNICDGSLSLPKLTLRYAFAENIKIHDGHIYFLWQDDRNASTRQLFVQR